MSEFLKGIAKQCRRRILTMAHAANGGHIGGSFSVIDILVALYDGPLNSQNANPGRLIFSKGHSCLALYTVLARIGVLGEEYLEGYCVNGGKLHGHPHHGVPGVEVSTGSLGHGPSIAVGMALADKLDGINRQMFCIVGDGECNEGSLWEALLMGAQQELGNLTFIIDANKMESLDFTKNILDIYPLATKLTAMGWNTSTIDGHSIEGLQYLLNLDANQLGGVSTRPNAIIANTTKGKGVSFMENESKWHYRAPSDEELKLAMKELE